MFSSSNWPFTAPRKPARNRAKPAVVRRQASAWTGHTLREVAPTLPGTLLSVKTVAQRCDLSENKVRELIREGALPTVSLGRSLLRVPEIALTYLAESGTRLHLELY